MAGKSLFYYLGEDEGYFKGLQAEFAKHTKLPISFKRFYESEEAKIQSLFIKINKDLPSVVFIDFSKCPQDYLHLARLLTRSNFETKILFVGLLDLLAAPAVLNESLVTGLDLTHYKSPEMFDLVFDTVKLFEPNQMSDHGFATATLKETWEGGILSKIGFVHSDGLHFETDFPLEVGSTISINHCWLEKKIIPSKKIIIKNISQSNIFYQFKFAVDAEFVFIDELVADEGTTEEDLANREVDRQDLIKRHKKLFNAWLDDNLSSSQEKIAKVLIIDKEFHFYQNQKRTDKHPYLIRCLSHTDDIDQQLKRICPQVVAVALEDEKLPDVKNNYAFLEKLVSVIKRRDQADWPYIVIFNTALPSKALQNQLGYPHLMSASNELSVEVLVRMAAVFEKRLLESRPAANKKTKQVFIKKTNAASVTEILVPINLTKVSETDLSFQCALPLPMGTNLRVKSPVPCVIHTLPAKAQGKVLEFNGLIHCLSEVNKKELRRYVNAVFFRDHDAQVSTDVEEFKKLNEAKLQEKMEAQKKEQEALDEKKEEESGT